MRYKIVEIVQTKKGKSGQLFHIVKLEDDKGNVSTNVYVWKSNVKVGDEIEGNVIEKKISDSATIYQLKEIKSQQDKENLKPILERIEKKLDMLITKLVEEEEENPLD